MKQEMKEIHIVDVPQDQKTRYLMQQSNKLRYFRVQEIFMSIEEALEWVYKETTVVIEI